MISTVNEESLHSLISSSLATLFFNRSIHQALLRSSSEQELKQIHPTKGLPIEYIEWCAWIGSEKERIPSVQKNGISESTCPPLKAFDNQYPWNGDQPGQIVVTLWEGERGGGKLCCWHLVPMTHGTSKWRNLEEWATDWKELNGLIQSLVDGHQDCFQWFKQLVIWC